VSCGFDSGDGDTIGNLKISKVGYKFMARELKSLNKPILAVLEGGYNEKVLGWGSQAMVDGLVEDNEDERVTALKEKN
jgi:acetoin utilization deacetylase AcuC-like enzyme